MEIKINKDIRDIEPKVIGPLTTRQLVCCVIGAGLGIFTGILVPGSAMTKVIVGCIFAAIPILCGWIKWMGLPPEQFVPLMCKIYFEPQNRKYISETIFPNLAPQEEIKKTKKSKEFKAYL